MSETKREPLVLYVDHQEKKIALAYGFDNGLYSPIEVYFRCVDELIKLKKHFEGEGYQYSSPQFMQNSNKIQDGEASILLNITSIPCS